MRHSTSNENLKLRLVSGSLDGGELPDFGASTIDELLQRSVAKAPTAPALSALGATISYQQLHDLSEGVSAWLLDQGLQPGERVAVALPNMLAHPIACLGIIRAGLTAVCVNPLYTAQELAQVFRDSEIKAVFLFEPMGQGVQQAMQEAGVKIAVRVAPGDQLGWRRPLVCGFHGHPATYSMSIWPDTWKAACTDVLEFWPEATVPKAIERFYGKTAPFQYNQGWLGWRGFLKRLLVRVSGLKRAVMRAPNSIAEMRLWAVKSTALAAQNLMLAFQSHGYGTCPMEGFDEKRLRKLLPIPDKAIPIMLLAVGIPGERAVYNPRLRFPIEASVTWH